jgi:transcription factor Sp
MNLTQLSGQTVALRQGNVMQTLQLPMNSLQQTITVQVPMTTQNGQTLYQTMQLPISALSGLTGQQVIQQMPQQIQMAQIQIPQQATSQVKQEGSIDNQSNNQSQVNNQQQNQNVIATINLPNGQLGQLIAAPQAQTVWNSNALNLSNLTAVQVQGGQQIIAASPAAIQSLGLNSTGNFITSVPSNGQQVGFPFFFFTDSINLIFFFLQKDPNSNNIYFKCNYFT